MLTTFEEILMTMTMAQKINKSGWMDPVMTGDKVEATTCLRCREIG